MFITCNGRCFLFLVNHDLFLYRSEFLVYLHGYTLLLLLVLTGGWSKAVVVQLAEKVLQKQLYCSLMPQIWTLAAMKMI